MPTLTPAAEKYFHDSVKRSSFLSPRTKAHLHTGIEHGEVKKADVEALGESLRVIVDKKKFEHRVQRDRLEAIEAHALEMKPSEAIKFLLDHAQHLRIDRPLPPEMQRRFIGWTLRAARKAEKGDYNIKRGVDGYNEWLGVDLVEEARTLADKHGKIVAADIGGGRGRAMSDLKRTLGAKIDPHFTSLVPHYPLNKTETPVFEPKYAPTAHIAHGEGLPFGSGTTHLVVSCRGGTHYASSRLIEHLREITRTMRPGAKAFLQIREPTEEMEKRIAAHMRRDGIDLQYRYGVIEKVKNRPDKPDGLLHIFRDAAARERKYRELEGAKGLNRYRILYLEKR